MGSAWKPMGRPGPTRPCLARASDSEGTLCGCPWRRAGSVRAGQKPSRSLSIEFLLQTGKRRGTSKPQPACVDRGTSGQGVREGSMSESQQRHSPCPLAGCKAPAFPPLSPGGGSKATSGTPSPGPSLSLLFSSGTFFSLVAFDMAVH